MERFAGPSGLVLVLTALGTAIKTPWTRGRRQERLHAGPLFANAVRPAVHPRVPEGIELLLEVHG